MWGLWVGLLLLGLTVLYGFGNRSYGLFDVDEAIFTQATQELKAAASQHGLAALAMPTYNGEPRYHKPPLIYWVQSLTLGLTGAGFMPGDWGLLGARLPSILGALGSIILLGGAIGWLTGNRRWALLAATVLGLNLSFLVVGRAATADGLLNFFSLALTVWVLLLLFPRTAQTSHTPLRRQVRTMLQAQALRRWGWAITGVLAGLAFLAKGPIGWLAAGIVGVTVLWARPNRAATWRVLAPFKVAVVVGLVLLPWLWLLARQHGWGFFYEFIMVHNLQRFGGDLGNSQSDFAGYYLLVLLVGFFPWVALLPRALRLLWQAATPRRARALLASPEAAVALPALAAVWAVIYILFFSFSGTKLAHYIVPAYPALALLVGWVLSTPTAPRRSPVWAVLPWVLGGALLAGVLGLLGPVLQGMQNLSLTGLPALAQLWLGFPWPLPDPLANAVLQQAIPLGWGMPLVGGGLFLTTTLLAGLLRGRYRWLVALIMAWAATLMLIVHSVVPLVWAYTQAPLARVASTLRQLPPASVVVHHGLHKPSLLLLSGKPFEKTDHPLQILPLLARTPELWVVAEVQDIPPLLAELDRSRSGLLVDARCSAGTCLLLLAPLQTLQRSPTLAPRS